MPRFNGHKNWNHWNVSLWINNDEGLYNMALDHLRNIRGMGVTRKWSAARMLEDLREMGITKTPDGAPYSVSSILAAMRGM